MPTFDEKISEIDSSFWVKLFIWCLVSNKKFLLIGKQRPMGTTIYAIGLLNITGIPSKPHAEVIQKEHFAPR